MRFINGIALLVVVALAVGVIYIQSLPDNVVAVGEPVRQDDFLYTVTRVVKHRDDASIWYVVTIRVDNEAKVVDYRWRDEIAYVTDAAGRRYRALNDPQSTTDRPPIPAGASATYTLTCELPASERHPTLHYSNGILMGDVFDGAAYQRAAISL